MGAEMLHGSLRGGDSAKWRASTYINFAICKWIFTRWRRPNASGQQSPADLDLAELGLIAMVAAGADQAAGRAIDKCKTNFRIDRAISSSRGLKGRP
jgi:hypothetical protein